MYKFKKIEKDGTTTYIISVDGTDATVTKEVYDFLYHEKENQRYRARRDGKCATANYRICDGDCGNCRYQQEGYRILSYHKVFGDEFEYETSSMYEGTPSLEDMATDRILLKDLYRQLDEVIPDGAKVFRMRVQNFSQREIARALGGISQSTLNPRIKKLDKFINDHRAELEDLLH